MNFQHFITFYFFSFRKLGGKHVALFATATTPLPQASLPQPKCFKSKFLSNSLNIRSLQAGQDCY